MAIGDKDIDESKLAGIIEDSLSDIRFDKMNFAWHMGNKSPRIQQEFWELTYAFIQEMADYYKRGLVDTKHLAVAQMCYEVKQYLEGDYDKDQLALDLGL